MPKVQAIREPTNPIFTVVLVEWSEEEYRRNKANAPTIARGQDLFVLDARVVAAKPVSSTLGALNTALGTPRDGLKWPTAEHLMRCAGCFKPQQDGKPAYYVTCLLQKATPGKPVVNGAATSWQVREFPRLVCANCFSSWHKMAPAIVYRPLDQAGSVLSVLVSWGSSLDHGVIELLDRLGRLLQAQTPSSVFAGLQAKQAAVAAAATPKITARAPGTQTAATTTTKKGAASPLFLHCSLEGLLIDFENLPKTPQCNYCESASQRLRRCSGCYVVSYCSVSHRNLDWNRGHKDVCELGVREEHVPGYDKWEPPPFG